MTDLIPLIEAHPNASDAEIVALANVPTYSKIPVATIREIVPPITIVPTLQLMAWNETLDAQTRGLAIAVINVLAGVFTVVDRTNPIDNAGYESMIPSVLAMELITQEQATILLGLGKEQSSYTEADVAAERLAIAERAAAAAAEAAAQAIRDELHNQLAGRVAAVTAQIEDGTWTTWDQVKAALGA
jgi:hypothetical protein